MAESIIFGMKSLISLSIITFVLFSVTQARIFVDPHHDVNSKAPKRSHKLFLDHKISPMPIQLKSVPTSKEIYPLTKR